MGGIVAKFGLLVSPALMEGRGDLGMGDDLGGDSGEGLAWSHPDPDQKVMFSGP